MSKKYFAKWNLYLLQMINCLDIFLTTINPAIKQQRWNGKCFISLKKKKRQVWDDFEHLTVEVTYFLLAVVSTFTYWQKKVWKLNSHFYLHMMPESGNLWNKSIWILKRQIQMRIHTHKLRVHRVSRIRLQYSEIFWTPQKYADKMSGIMY